MQKKVLITSKWLDQSRSRDPMKGRVVLLQEFDNSGKPFQFIITKQWEDSSYPDWENPPRPNYTSGSFYQEEELTDQILFDFYKESAKMFAWYLHREPVYKNLAKEVEAVFKSKTKIPEKELKKIMTKLKSNFFQMTKDLL